MKKCIMFLAIAMIASVSVGATFPVWGEPGTLDEGLIGNWDVAGNWAQYTDDPAWAPTGLTVLPDATDVALIKTGEVTVDSVVGPVVGIELGELDAELNITTGASLSVSINNMSVGVFGTTGTATLNMDGGSLAVGGTQAFYVGNGSEGIVNFTGGTVDITASFGLKAGNSDGVYDAKAEIYINQTDVTITKDVNIGVSGGGSAIIEQDSGNVAIGGSLLLGDRLEATSAEYIINNGTMTARAIMMGFRGCKSTFTINGGSVATEDFNGTLRDIAVGKQSRLDYSNANLATLNINGGEVLTNDMWAAYDPNTTAVINMTGGLLTATGQIEITRDVSASAEMIISGGELQTNANLTVGYGDNRTVGQGGGEAVFTVLGSDPNIMIGGRLDAKNKLNATVKFVMDADGVATINTAGLTLLLGSGTTLAVDVLPEFDGQEGDTFDVITSTNSDANPLQVSGINMLNVSPYYTFSRSNVDSNDDGRIDTLRLTLESVNIDDCDDVKGAGKLKAGDLNDDCMVDLADFAIMAADWLDCTNPQGCN